MVALGDAPSPASAPASAPAALTLRKNEVILFLGDELIDATDPRGSTNFSFLVETFLTVRYPELRARFIHAGWSGDTAGRALLRLHRDVLSRRPSLVVVCLGLNDPEYLPFSEERLARFKQDMSALTGRLKQAGVRVWLVSPPSVREALGQNARILRGGQASIANLQAIGYNATLARYAATVREVATESGCGFVDWFAASMAMRPVAGAGAGPWRDGRLPPPQGHALVAMELLRAWGAQPVEAVVEMKWGAPTAMVTSHLGPGGTVPVQVDAHGRRTLDLKGLPLPWPMPGVRMGALRAEWEAAGMCQFTLRVPDAPARGILLRLEPGERGSAAEFSLSAAQAREGVNLGTGEFLRTLRPLQDLIQAIGLKNYYWYSTWRRQELNPAREPELAEAQRQLMAALYAYSAGYEQIVWRMPKTFDARIVLAEAVPPERVPTASPIGTRPAGIPMTQPATMPTSAPATQPTTQAQP